MRKRRTKDPCPRCLLFRPRCICPFIPSLVLNTRVSILIHYKELERSSNTGRLAHYALTNSELIVRGRKTQAKDLSELIDSSYLQLLLFPTTDAQELGQIVAARDPRPVHLIVPDGSWRQAGKVTIRHKELAGIPRAKLDGNVIGPQNLRRSKKEQAQATLAAIAHALGLIEGKEIEKKLLGLYQKKLEHTLIGRSSYLPRST